MEIVSPVDMNRSKEHAPIFLFVQQSPAFVQKKTPFVGYLNGISTFVSP
jgi:hypothetical protein